MSDKKIGIALILSAMDKASMVVNAFTNNAISKLSRLQKSSSALADKQFRAGQQLVTAGVAAAAPIMATVKAYADLEDAQLSLQSTMMKSNGRVAREFTKINKLAIDLGNALPGTTEDFYRMFETMIRNGARYNDIINGTGKAAAYLAVQLKLPYSEAGEMVQRLQTATGTANRDMMRFMDTLARVNQLGPSVQEMQMAFMRSGGELKMLKVQGLQATQEISNVYAMLIKTMGSGERVGTGFAAVLAGLGDSKAMAKFDALQKSMGLNMRFMDRKGDFLGIENMMQQFDKMRSLTTGQKNLLFTALAGGKGADNQIVATLVNEGMVGYKKMQLAQQQQAALNQKVQLQLGGLKNQYDAVKGTMVNAAAAIGEKLRPEINAFLVKVNNFLPKLISFIENHKTLVVWVLKAVIAFSGLALAGGYISLMFAGISRGVSTVATVFKYGGMVLRGFTFVLFALRYSFVFRVLPALRMVGMAIMWLGRVLLANPIILIIAGIAMAVYLIYKYWGPIKEFFINLWANIKSVFVGAWKWLTGLTGAFTNAGINIVKSIWTGMKKVAHMPVDLIKGIAKKIRNFLPFSPAKEGALKDIHRIRLVETIAASIKPNALINAWSRTMGTFRDNIGGGAGLPAMGNSVSSKMVFAPVINLNGGATKEDAKMLTDEMQRQFDRMMKEYQLRTQRVRY